MSRFKTYTELTDSGPYVTRLLLELPQPVAAGAADPDTFSVYVRRLDRHTGEVIRTKTGAFSPESLKAIADERSCGWRRVTAVYPCDENGARAPMGNWLALELSWGPLEPLSLGSTPRNSYQNDFVDFDFRITQLKPLVGAPECSGLVFDVCRGDVCPRAAGWQFRTEIDPDHPFRYAWFRPSGQPEGKRPLLIWLHGAGGGGEDPRYPIMGNRVTAFSQPEGQKKLGYPWIYVPQCPTMWMDDGRGTPLMQNNDSQYVAPLKAAIDAFVAEHEAEIDRSRIYVAGASNGGFMTVMQVMTYPGFYAAGVPVCEAVVTDLLQQDQIAALAKTPLWFVHVKNDFVVDPDRTVVPLYRRLKAAGAPVHFTYLDRVEDETGLFKNADGTPYRYIPHFAWVPTYNDACRTDFDGSSVVVDGQAVSLQEWLGLQTLASL